MINVVSNSFTNIRQSKETSIDIFIIIGNFPCHVTLFSVPFLSCTWKIFASGYSSEVHFFENHQKDATD